MNEEKCILFKNCIFYRVFLFLIDKVLLIDTAVRFDVLFAVSLSGDFFPGLYIFVVSIITS